MDIIKKIKNIIIGDNHSASYYEKTYSVEIELIKGIHKNLNNHPSIIHFSFNKAATQYVKSILRTCAIENGMTPVSLHDYAFNTKFPFLDKLSAEDMKKYQHIFKDKGYLYSVFGGMIEGIPALENFKVILAVRDPRDLLVSEYYSTAVSHPVPNIEGDKYDKFMKNREIARASTIDQYVINVSERLNNTYNRFYDLLINKYDAVYIIKYEDMVADFNGWLNGLLCYCDLRVSDSLKNNILFDNELAKPKKEDISKHLRKGTPEDYKEKLKPETITTLNAVFSENLVRFGYAE